jgi:hypothetical protein
MWFPVVIGNANNLIFTITEAGMDYYVKELANRKAVLVAVDGYELGEFPTVDAAVTACEVGCMVRPLYVQQHRCYLQAGPNATESSFLPHANTVEQSLRFFLGRP